MSLVTSETIYRSTEICLLMLIARGWTFIRKGLQADDLGSLTIMMGLVYMSYCAMFVTFDIEEAQSTIQVWMMLLHTFIAWDVHRNVNMCEEMLQKTILEAAANGSSVRQCLDLKLLMLTWYRRLTLAFLGSTIIFQGFIPLMFYESRRFNNFDACTCVLDLCF